MIAGERDGQCGWCCLLRGPASNFLLCTTPMTSELPNLRRSTLVAYRDTVVLAESEAYLQVLDYVMCTSLDVHVVRGRWRREWPGLGKMDESRASSSVWIRRGNDTKQGVDNATRDSGNNEKNSSYSLTTQFLSCLVIEC